MSWANRVFLAAAGVILALPAGAQDCSSLPAVPTAATTATQDRDRMLCIQGITIPTLPPIASDPNKPSNVIPRGTAWTDPRGHTVARTLFGLYHTYDSGTAANPLPLGGAMSGYGDYGPESTPRYPDIELLKMKDGTPVVSPEDWWTKRRPEIFDLVQKELYGRMWDKSLWPEVTWTVGPVTTGTQAATGMGPTLYPWHQKTITGTISTSTYSPRNRPVITVTCRLPGLAATPGVEVPVIIQFGSATTVFGYTAPYGIGGCGFAQASLQPDSGGQALSSYLIGLVNKGEWRKPEDPGALVAWAWGVGRIVDYFNTIDTEIDGDKVGLEGHSRFGKATLVAAAYDERIVAAYPSCGGSLGTSWARRAYGETLEYVASTTNEYHWVNGNIMNYMGPLSPGQFWPRKVELLDVDTHSMMSLIAPRAVFTNGGTDNANGNADAWQDPRGMFLAGKVSGPVWEFLGWPGQIIPPGTVFTTDMPDSAYPPPGAPATYRKIDESRGGTPPFNVAFIEGTVGYRRHAEGHTDGPGWPSFALFASRYLKDKRPVVVEGQTFTLPALGSSVLGTLQATDGDGEPLGDWQVTGGTGAYKFLVDPQTGAITVGDRLALDVSTRSYELSVIVGDGKLASHRQSVTIQVPADVAPPVFTTLAASQTSIWPPNHQMVPITLTAATTDNFDPAPTSPRIVSVTSNESINAQGDGNTSPDWTITGPLTVDLRAERSGKGSGRVYTITVESTDRSGNVARRTVTVTVAHNQ